MRTRYIEPTYPHILFVRPTPIRCKQFRSNSLRSPIPSQPRFLQFFEIKEPISAPINRLFSSGSYFWFRPALNLFVQLYAPFQRHEPRYRMPMYRTAHLSFDLGHGRSFEGFTVPAPSHQTPQLIFRVQHGVIGGYWSLISINKNHNTCHIG